MWTLRQIHLYIVITVYHFDFKCFVWNLLINILAVSTLKYLNLFDPNLLKYELLSIAWTVNNYFNADPFNLDRNAVRRVFSIHVSIIILTQSCQNILISNIILYIGKV